MTRLRPEVEVDGSSPDDDGVVPPAGDSPEHNPLADLPGDWSSLVIPDDPAALAAEAAAVRAELARERRRRRWASLLPVAQPGLTVPMLAFGVLVLTAFGCLLVAVLPAGAPLLRAQPLAASTAGTGHRGGLLPDVQLVDDAGALFPVRDLRPGVVLVVGDACDCSALVAEYIHATAEARVRLLVVGDRRAPLLPETGFRGAVVTGSDPAGRLRFALDPPFDRPPRAILVRADGVIFRDLPNGRDVVHLRQDLATLT